MEAAGKISNLSELIQMPGKVGFSLSEKEYNLILENSCADLFATDGRGKIIYANKDSVQVLGCPRERLLQMDIYQLREEGYVSYSMTDEVLRTRKQTTGTYFNKAGQEVACVSTPIFDENNELCMVVTYSRRMDILETFQKELQQEKEKLRGYQAAMEMMDYSHSEGDIIVIDPIMKKIFSTAETLAKMDSTIMLYGESGVGKEVVANFIRRSSMRKDNIFVPVNCAAIPNDLIESELFGYEKGAFTGASKEGRAGLFEIADEGTIFLDEVGELPMPAQAKLLRVLENGEFRRIGSNQAQKTNVRIIAATNRDLKSMVEKNLFRNDLYYRLNVVPITIPPLRDRPDDIQGLAAVFLARFNRKHGKARALSISDLERIRCYSWPGNIRELRNAIERFVLIGELPPLENDMGGIAAAEQAANREQVPVRSLKEVMEEQESQYILQSLTKYDGDVEQTAAALGISRSGLYKKIKRAKELTAD